MCHIVVATVRNLTPSNLILVLEQAAVRRLIERQEQLSLGCEFAGLDSNKAGIWHIESVDDSSLERCGWMKSEMGSDLAHL